MQWLKAIKRLDNQLSFYKAGYQGLANREFDHLN